MNNLIEMVVDKYNDRQDGKKCTSHKINIMKQKRHKNDSPSDRTNSAINKIIASILRSYTVSIMSIVFTVHIRLFWSANYKDQPRALN